MNSFYKDGMFGLIVGDSVGLPVQFEPRVFRKEDPVTDMRGYGCFDVPKGSWTDDSSLALATLCSIKDKGCIDLVDIADRFMFWLVDGEYTPFGYAYDIGNGCLTSIARYARSGDVTTCGGRGEHDNGNGSLMRILPGCIKAYEELRSGNMTIKEAISMVEALSALTHAHKRAKIACGLYFFMVKAILDYKMYEGSDIGLPENILSVSELIDLLQAGIDEGRDYYIDIPSLTEVVKYGRMFDLKSFKDTPEDDIKSSGYVVDSIEAAVWSLVNTNSYKDCILKAVNLGDDTDTVAAIAGGLAGLYYGYDAIPNEWKGSIIKKEWIEGIIQ